MSSQDGSSDVHRVRRTPWGKRWDLEKRVVDLEGGKQLTYEGKEALYEGAYGVIFPCKLRLGGEDDYKVIDAVVKCEKKECNGQDGYEVRKWEEIPSHDNLVKFYGGKVLELGDSALFGALLVFEKMDCNLEELLFKDKTFAENCTYGDLVEILLQIVRGLIHLHESGFLHMDLKLQNFLVSKKSEGGLLVKIGDFGESKALKDTKNSVTATHRGTQAYMAPEVLMAPRFRDKTSRITAHADVYSFGIVMCALFNKQEPPFNSQDYGGVGREIDVGHFQSYKVFCRAPLELCDLIEKCLHFQISHLHDSRNHGRPSFEEILSILEELRNRDWLSQKVQSKVAEHHASAPMEDHAGVNVDGTNSAPGNSCGEIGGTSGGAGALEVSEETENRTAVSPVVGNSSGESTAILTDAGVTDALIGDNFSETGKTSLETGHSEQNINVVESSAGEGVLYPAGGDVSLTDSVVGDNYLQQAAAEGSGGSAEISLEAGEDLNLRKSVVGIGSQHQTATNGPAKTSKVSMKAGKNINLTNSVVGSVGPHHAGAKGTATTSKVSLKAGKNINLTNSVVGSVGPHHAGAKTPTQPAKIALNAGPSSK